MLSKDAKPSTLKQTRLASVTRTDDPVIIPDAAPALVPRYK